MKSYFKYTDEDKTECFLELDDEFYCERAIYKTAEDLINTYLTIEHNRYFLPEGSMEDSVVFFENISKSEFDLLWKESTLKFENHWKEFKSKYAVGDKVKTKILCFYPNWVVSNFGEIFNAVSDYKSCVEKIGSNKMYPNTEIEMIISAFDDINKIVRLKIDK